MLEINVAILSNDDNLIYFRHVCKKYWSELQEYICLILLLVSELSTS
jgi:hypothetical protein